WKVTLKEKMLQENMEMLLENLSSEYEVSTDMGDQTTTYSLTKPNEKSAISIMHKGVMPSNHGQTGEWITVISGTEWNEEIRLQYEQIRDSTLLRIFSESVHKYT